MTERNLTMLTDFYEFTMANGYFEKGMGDRRAYFDMFFRRVPDGGGYAIMAGVEQLIEYFNNLHFTEEDIAYLRSRKCFSESFLNYLRDFEFECDVWAVPEGTPVFPGEPLVTVAGPMIQAQFVETMILLTVNHQTLIATKANRITRAAQKAVRCARVRLPPRAGLRRRDLWRARRLYRRLPRHRLRTGRPRPQDPRRRHDGALLGADVRQRVRSLQGILPRSIRTTACSLSIPIMCSSPVCRTPSA